MPQQFSLGLTPSLTAQLASCTGSLTCNAIVLQIDRFRVVVVRYNGIAVELTITFIPSFSPAPVGVGKDRINPHHPSAAAQLTSRVSKLTQHTFKH